MQRQYPRPTARSGSAGPPLGREAQAVAPGELNLLDRGHHYGLSHMPTGTDRATSAPSGTPRRWQGRKIAAVAVTTAVYLRWLTG